MSAVEVSSMPEDIVAVTNNIKNILADDDASDANDNIVKEMQHVLDLITDCESYTSHLKLFDEKYIEWKIKTKKLLSAEDLVNLLMKLFKEKVIKAKPEVLQLFHTRFREKYDFLKEVDAGVLLNKICEDDEDYAYTQLSHTLNYWDDEYNVEKNEATGVLLSHIKRFNECDLHTVVHFFGKDHEFSKRVAMRMIQNNDLLPVVDAFGETQVDKWKNEWQTEIISFMCGRT
ncbi:hypothetical protein CYMTET_3003 [Cymbomonas tetramitiformis]|uniref:Uncharacterized protein n=1 Tax=Cymbomonas tetramitiformis TaxID=36881 RepID=A0AAE0H5W7_9CHLO|nr:hypothetical protein CYMTET_3003 [Cymbomonas tetramitiformis]